MQRSYHWILFYWMPYDNNLWEFAVPIIQMLSRGALGENILVVVVSDLEGEGLLSRRLITKGGILETQQLAVADSSSEEIYADQLNWVHSQFSAEKWSLVFLGHGGRLDEISPDVHPGPGVKIDTQWMNIEKLGYVLENFNQRVNESVELLFLQNCCKGTLEASYTFRNAARYTLSSQTVLGAPNYYYEPALQFLGEHPEISGGEFAEKIMEFESEDMYNSYTVTHNHAVCQLPAKLNPLIEAILACDIKTVQIDDMLTYQYADEQLVDVLSFFRSLLNQVGAEQQKYDEFLDFFTNTMIHRFQESPRNRHPGFSGLNLFLPSKKEELEKYQHMQVFSDLKLIELFNAVLPD